MSDEIRPECQSTFDHINEKLDGISRAVVGNGNTKDSIASRVAGLEAGRNIGWKAVSAIGVVVAILIAVLK